MANWYLTGYKGKLAITLGWSDYNQTPIRTRDLWVSPNEPWDEKYYSRYSQVRLLENNHFICFDHILYTDKMLYTNGWAHETESEPIKPPSKGGKDWHYEWSNWNHKYQKVFD